MPPANAAPTAGAVPEGVVKVLSASHATITSSPSALAVADRSFWLGPAGVAENASGAPTASSFSSSKTFITAMCCMLVAPESAARLGGGRPLAQVMRVSYTMPLA